MSKKTKQNNMYDNLKIFIHGTHGGHKLLWNNFPSAEQYIEDIRNNNNDDNLLNQEFYSIKFCNEGSIFSKFKLITDAQGDNRLGFIAIAVLVPPEKKVDKHILKILDYLLNHWKEIRDIHNFNAGINNYISREKIKYISKDQNSIDRDKKRLQVNLKSQEEKNAYIYYQADCLQNYFQFPFQEMYKGYKQIYLIDKNLEKPENNPLLFLESGDDISNNENFIFSEEIIKDKKASNVKFSDKFTLKVIFKCLVLTLLTACTVLLYLNNKELREIKKQFDNIKSETLLQ